MLLWAAALTVTYLLPHGLCRHQQRFNGDEECDECSLTLVPERVVTADWTSVPLLTVAQQHCWCVHPERSINLPSGTKSHHAKQLLSW